MAQRDGLTGLYNSLYLRDALDRELARSRRAGRPFSLLFADIDHFKTFNDTHGHLAGADSAGVPTSGSRSDRTKHGRPWDPLWDLNGYRISPSTHNRHSG